MTLSKRVVVVFVLAVAALSLTASAQVIDVVQMQGTTQGEKLANAQASCVAGLGACVLRMRPEITAYPAGTSPALCSNCVLDDWRTPTTATTPFVLSGAFGDGTHDDTAAFALAMATHPLGGTLIVPGSSSSLPKKYKVCDLPISGAWVFWGMGTVGWESNLALLPTQIVCDKAGSNIFHVVSASGSGTLQHIGPEFVNLVLVDTTNAGAGGSLAHGILVDTTNRGRIRGVEFDHFTGASSVPLTINANGQDANYWVVENMRAKLCGLACVQVIGTGGTFIGGEITTGTNAIGIDIQSTASTVAVLNTSIEVSSGGTCVKSSGYQSNVQARCEAITGSTNTIGHDIFGRRSNFGGSLNKFTKPIVFESGAFGNSDTASLENNTLLPMDLSGGLNWACSPSNLGECSLGYGGVGFAAEASAAPATGSNTSLVYSHGQNLGIQFGESAERHDVSSATRVGTTVTLVLYSPLKTAAAKQITVHQCSVAAYNGTFSLATISGDLLTLTYTVGTSLNDSATGCRVNRTSGYNLAVSDANVANIGAGYRGGTSASTQTAHATAGSETTFSADTFTVHTFTGATVGSTIGGLRKDRLIISPTGVTWNKTDGTTAGTLDNSGNLILPTIKSTTGSRYVCVDSTGKLVSQAAACSGT